MTDEKKEKKKEYVKPVITRVKLEDKRVVAMAVCKDDQEASGCLQGGFAPTFDIDPS